MTKISHGRKDTPRQAPSGSHRYAIGQTVRLTGMGPGIAARVGDLYRITGTAPASGSEPQYRIRNDIEAFERMTTEDRLELVTGPRSAGNALFDRMPRDK